MEIAYVVYIQTEEGRLFLGYGKWTTDLGKSQPLGKPTAKWLARELGAEWEHISSLWH